MFLPNAVCDILFSVIVSDFCQSSKINISCCFVLLLLFIQVNAAALSNQPLSALIFHSIIVLFNKLGE